MSKFDFGKLQVAAATTKRRQAVKDNGSGKLTPCTAQSDACLGILPEKYDAADDRANLSIAGVQSVLCEGTVSAFDFLCPSATAGALEKANPGDNCVGFALAAGQDGTNTHAFIAPGGGQPLPMAVQFSVTVNAEAANVIGIDIVVQDMFGNAVAEATAFEAYTVGEVGSSTVNPPFTLSDGGDGTLIGNDARQGITMLTTAAGLASVDVTDVAGASGDTVVVVFRPIGTIGVPAYATVTFD